MSEQHEHRWKKCAWIQWDDWYECPPYPTYYHPSKLIPVEVCEVAGCGLIRVPPENLKKITEKGRT